MRKIVPIFKPAGKTPLDMVKHFKKLEKDCANETVSYAGRLDPMADGVLILLVGGENKKRSTHEKLEKVYESEIVLGITTDSHDALGIIGRVSEKYSINDREIVESLGNFLGESFQNFPSYSSKTVNGKPLFWWARNNRISEISIPKKKIKISKIQLMEIRVVGGKDLADLALQKIDKVFGDFRQDEIKGSWEKFKKRNGREEFSVVKIVVECSGGTYIRQLAFDIGKALGIGGFALSITRTKVGKYRLSDCLKV